MANLRIRSSSKDKNIVIGLFKPNGYCKKHPKHRQSPGVCSLCLSHKLSQLSSSSNSNSKIKISSPISSSSSVSSLSSYCSSSPSSCASPMHPFQIFLFNNANKQGGGGLVKSKSMAVVPRRRSRMNGVDDDHKRSINNKKSSGFWFKLLHPKKKLFHSGSLREAIAVDS